MGGLQLWVGVFAGVAVFCLLQALFWIVRTRLRGEEEQLSRRLRGQHDGEVLEEGGGIRVRGDGAGALQRLRARAEQLGIESLSQLALRSGFFVLLAGVLTAVVVGSVTGGLLGGCIAVAVVYVYLARRRAQAVEQLERQVPQALEVMTFSLRAGHAFEEAVRLASEEVGAPLSTELRRCYQESVMGRPIESALEQVRVRWREVRSLGFFVEAITVLKRTGGNLVEVMDRIVSNLREQAAYRAKHRALTSEGRTSAKILMAIPFVALAGQALLSPEQLGAMFDSPTGQTVLVLAGGLWTAGALWISRLARAR